MTEQESLRITLKVGGKVQTVRNIAVGEKPWDNWPHGENPYMVYLQMRAEAAGFEMVGARPKIHDDLHHLAGELWRLHFDFMSRFRLALPNRGVSSARNETVRRVNT